MSRTRVPEDLPSYQRHYSEAGFWKKARRLVGKIGAKGLYMALQLYYALQSPNLTKSQRAIVIGALGYLILPVDLIPDFILGLGFTDDIGALAAALLSLGVAIDDGVRSKAKSKLQEWLGSEAAAKLD